MTVAPDGSVYVVGRDQNRVLKFDSVGHPLCGIGPAAGARDFSVPSDVACASNGDVFISDGANLRIVSVNGTCGFRSEWSTDPTLYPNYVQIDRARGVFYDVWYNFVQAFALDGTPLATWEWLPQLPYSFDVVRFAVGPSGNLYFPEFVGSTIRVYSPKGVHLYDFGPDTGSAALQHPIGVACDAQENLYVIDASSTVKKYSSTGEFLFAFGSPGRGPGQLGNPVDWCTDDSLNFYLLDALDHRVQKWSPQTDTPTLHHSWGGLKLRYR
jgi:hypothetical protein